MSLNKIATANNYKDNKSLPPFLGSFSNFKADDQFLNLSIAMHYKKLLAISDTSKYHFYFVLGPSLDTRLSAQSADNLMNNNYARFLLRGDVGFEFENKNFYTLFLHYKQGLTSFTKSPIKTNVNSFELGMMIKASQWFILKVKPILNTKTTWKNIYYIVYLQLAHSWVPAPRIQH